MSTNEEDLNECSVCEEDAGGDPNLCCCYATDEGGALEDPCWHPAEECCC
jgi:hypothetical protein